MVPTPRKWPPEGKFYAKCQTVAELWTIRYPHCNYSQACRLIAEDMGSAVRSVSRWIAGARERGLL